MHMWLMCNANVHWLMDIYKEQDDVIIYAFLKQSLWLLDGE